jgi:uncharacterized membrane protein
VYHQQVLVIGGYVRHFSFRPAVTLRGRKFKGLRGFAGKPLHPPLTDIPIGAYVLAAVFDVIATLGRHHGFARDFFHAGTFAFVGGAGVSVLAALTGFWDWLKSSQAGTQARRTINSHASIMVTVTVLALVDIALRLNDYHTRSYPNPAILVLSILVAVLITWGATYGGELVFDYGFNVETAGDHPVWHESETDVMPGHDKG